LYSYNIFKGRDIGLPGYNTVRKTYKLPIINDFNYFTKSSEKAVYLDNLYQKVDNLDLWVGLIGEKPVSDGILGDLGSAIVGDQFRRIRDADRFWYEK
jgi:peroxidase